VIGHGAGQDRAHDGQSASDPEHAGRVESVEPEVDGKGELVERDEKAAEPGEEVDGGQQPEVRRLHGGGERPRCAHGRRPSRRDGVRRAGAATALFGATEERGEGKRQEGDEAGLPQVGVAPADEHHHGLGERRRDGAREPVRRLHDRDRHAAPLHEPP
jgi:hypothetical protein